MVRVVEVRERGRDAPGAKARADVNVLAGLRLHRDVGRDVAGGRGAGEEQLFEIRMPVAVHVVGEEADRPPDGQVTWTSSSVP